MFPLFWWRELRYFLEFTSVPFSSIFLIYKNALIHLFFILFYCWVNALLLHSNVVPKFLSGKKKSLLKFLFTQFISLIISFKMKDFFFWQHKWHAPKMLNFKCGAAIVPHIYLYLKIVKRKKIKTLDDCFHIILMFVIVKF